MCVSNSSNCNDLECPWGSFPYCKPSHMRYFCTCAFIYLFYTYLLTNLLLGSRSIQPLHARDFEPMYRFCSHASTGSKASSLEDKAPWSSRIFIKWTGKLNISKHKHSSLWSFSPTCGLRIISQWHVDHRQVQSTFNRWPSPVDHTQCPALCTARWRLGVMQRVTQSAGVNQDLSTSLWPATCFLSRQTYWTTIRRKSASVVSTVSYLQVADEPIDKGNKNTLREHKPPPSTAWHN